MVFQGRRSRPKAQHRFLSPKRPFLAALDFSCVQGDYESYTMLLRVMLRLTDANNSAAEIFSYAAFKPCISVLMSTLSRTINFPQDSLTAEEHDTAPAETVIDIAASPISTCSSDLDSSFPRSCIRAYSAQKQGALLSRLSSLPSLGATYKNKKEVCAISRSDAVFLLGIVACFLLAAKLIAQTSTLPIAGTMKWYNANPGMQV